MRSIYNAMEVGIITAIVGGALAFAIGYTIHRTKVAGPARDRSDLDGAGRDPGPGGRRRLSLGLDRRSRRALRHDLDPGAGLHRPLHARHGQGASTSFLQIHRELEEAAWVCGKGTLGTIRTIVLPLARPGVIASMTLLFVLAIRELGSSLFLYTSNTMVMSVLLLDYYEGGNIGKTAAFSLVQTVLLGVLIGGANWLSRGRCAGRHRAPDKHKR